jgi:hypothetical protein
MIVWAQVNENGCVEMAGISRNPPEGHIPMPPGATPEMAPWIMHTPEGWQERPLLEEFQMVGSTALLLNIPDQTWAEVRDAETGVFLGHVTEDHNSLTITFPDPGSYRIEVFPPEPWVKPEIYVTTIEVPA